MARDILLARGHVRALTPAFYSAVAAGLYLFAHWPQLGGFVAPSAALLAALILIALFDAVYFVIPDGPVWFLAATGLGVSLLADPAGTPERLAAAAAGYASLRAVAWGYERWRGVAGVGEGDARLFAIAGLWVGFRGLPGCMIFAVVSALLSAAILMRAGGLRDARDAMPFGPHLALGLWLVWAVGPVELG